MPWDWPPEASQRSERAATVEKNEDHGGASQGDQGQGRKVGDQVEIHRDQVEIGGRAEDSAARLSTWFCTCLAAQPRSWPLRSNDGRPAPVMACHAERHSHGARAVPQPSHWRCIDGCGACCRLDPALRQEAIAALSPSQQRQYMSMVGPDGWCRHFDTGSRRCRIYDGRPDFCQVANLVDLFGGDRLGTADGDALAIACCKQQIRSEYGGRGKVMRRFLRAIRLR